MKTKINLAITFVEIVNKNSISQAASSLGITRSAASKNLLTLEDSLGFKLITRNTRTLSLTEPGHQYFNAISKILRALEQTENELSQYSNEPMGTLKIDSQVLFSKLYLSPLIRTFLKKHPKVKIELSNSDSATDVVSENIDLYFRTGEVKHQEVVAKKLMSICFKTVASPSYLDCFGSPDSIDDLINHNCINFKYPSDNRIFQWRFKINDELIHRKFEGNFYTNDPQEICNATLAGLGIAQLPNQLVDPLISSGDLIPLLANTATPSNSLFMCYHRYKRNELKVKVFKSELMTYLDTLHP